MRAKVGISESEWEVMKVVWDHPGCTAGEIVDFLAPRKDWNPSTIKTLLFRLVKKGVITHQEKGTRYLYRAAITWDDAVQKESQSFLQRVFDGAMLPLLSYFISSGNLNVEQIGELQEMLTEKLKKASA